MHQRKNCLRCEWNTDRFLLRGWLEDLRTPRGSSLFYAGTNNSGNAQRNELKCLLPIERLANLFNKQLGCTVRLIGRRRIIFGDRSISGSATVDAHRAGEYEALYVRRRRLPHQLTTTRDIDVGSRQRIGLKSAGQDTSEVDHYSDRIGLK